MVPSWPRLLVVLGVTLVLAAGCSDTADPVDPRAALLAAVTPELAAQIDADGHFLLPEVVDTNPHLGREETQALAVWASTILMPMVQGFLDETAQRHVPLSNLSVCGQVWAEQPNAVVPATVLPYAHWLFGPRWIVTFCRGRTPTIAIAVAAYATNLSLDSVGVFGSPAFGPRGDEFLWRGLPLGWQSGVSVTPETAAMLIAKQTGRLVDRVPRLVVPRVPTGLPFDAKWVVHLEQPVTVAGTDTAATWTTDELYVGNEWITASSNVTRAVMAADPTQPATVAIRIPAAPYTEPNTIEYLLTAQPGMALVLVSVVALGP